MFFVALFPICNSQYSIDSRNFLPLFSFCNIISFEFLFGCYCCCNFVLLLDLTVANACFIFCLKPLLVFLSLSIDVRFISEYVRFWLCDMCDRKMRNESGNIGLFNICSSILISTWNLCFFLLLFFLCFYFFALRILSAYWLSRHSLIQIYRKIWVIIFSSIDSTAYGAKYTQSIII